jgi:hypothetical protein
MTLIHLADSIMLPSSPDDPTPPNDARLSPGTKVEVRRRFDAKWARGFEVVEATTDGYRLRRLSDGEEIPVPFTPEDVRREKKNNTWWY